MFSLEAKLRPKYRIRVVYSWHCVRGPYPKFDGKGRVEMRLDRAILI
jgi:hypothetical protein